LLADVRERLASGEPKPEAIAAAVCWVIGKGNQRLGQGAGELRVKDLMSYFSLSQSSVSERGCQIMHAAGIKPASAYPAVRLRSPDLFGLRPQVANHRIA
jgi:hypothetical protein